MKSHLVSAAVLAASASAILYGESNVNHTCAINPKTYSVLSCDANATAANYDSCCVETYGGRILATQFWNTYTGLESEGQLLPKDTWSLHGLWPDFCNGSYTQYCDLSRQFDPNPSPKSQPDGTPIPRYNGSSTVTTFLTQLGKYDLLDWMNKYWINQGAPNADFWAHEFSKHATCYSTFDVPCYGPGYYEHQEMVDFYETAIRYYYELPTWSWLADACITPSNATDVSYTLSDIQNALVQAYGSMPYIGCSGPRYNETEAGKGSQDSGHTVLDEVWYNLFVYGKPQNGDWTPVNATGSVSSCATTKGAIKYYERSNGSTWA